MSYIFICMTLYMTNSPAVKKNCRDFSPLGGFPFGHLGVSPASRLRVHCVHCVSCEPDTGVHEEPLLLQYRVVALVPRAFHSTYAHRIAPPKTNGTAKGTGAPKMGRWFRGYEVASSKGVMHGVYLWSNGGDGATVA